MYQDRYSNKNVFLWKPFSISEVAGVVNKLKLGKAGGLDCSLPENFKYTGIEVIRILTILFKSMKNEEYIYPITSGDL